MKTGAACRKSDLMTSRILGTACLCRMDMKAEPTGRHTAGPMIDAKLVAVATAPDARVPDIPMEDV